MQNKVLSLEYKPTFWFFSLKKTCYGKQSLSDAGKIVNSLKNRVLNERLSSLLWYSSSM